MYTKHKVTSLNSSQEKCETNLQMTEKWITRESVEPMDAPRRHAIMLKEQFSMNT